MNASTDPVVPTPRPDVPVARELVNGLVHADTFWPQEELSEGDWVNHCIQMLAIGNDDLFVQEAGIETDPGRCVICLDAKPGNQGTYLGCQCGNSPDPLFYCHQCLNTHIEENDVNCKNTSNCNRLLPYLVLQRACEGGIFQAKLDDLNGTQKANLRFEDPVLQSLLGARDRVAFRYLNQLVTRVNDSSNNAFKIVACTREGCVFQTLVERDAASLAVPCYFHPQNHICVQCNDNYVAATEHHCRARNAFVSVEERREANSFPCPNCGSEIQRNDGCMHMTCTRCQHHWCWYCVWHFFGESGGEHGDKLVSYATQLEYNTHHLRPFHTNQPIFHRDSELLNAQHPYIRYCNRGADCRCKVPRTSDNPFTF